MTPLLLVTSTSAISADTAVHCANGASANGIVGLAADLVFAVWRLVLMVVGLILGLFKLVFAILNATIGGAIRLVISVIKRSFKLVIGTFLFATGIGRKRRKAKKVKEKAKTKAAKAKDKALDLAA